jgi:hypothetical protein
MHTFDVDPVMIERTKRRATGLRVECSSRDVMETGFDVQADAILLFNILHCENPGILLGHASNALRPRGEVLVIHWRHGETPRGPSLDIRPKPEQIVQWASEAGLQPACDTIDLPPWHFGLRLQAAVEV